MQQQQPGGLDQGIGRDPQAPGLVTQVLRALRIPMQVQRMVPDKLAVRLRRNTFGQQRRPLQGTQLLAPELLQLAHRLLGEPTDVVTEAPPRMAGRPAVINLQHLAQQP